MSLSPSVIVKVAELDSIEATCHIRRQGSEGIAAMINVAGQTTDPGNLFMKMFYLFGAYGQDTTALQMQAKALQYRNLFRIVAPNICKIKLLALVAAGHMMDNTPLDFLIENSDIQLELLYLHENFELPIEVPEHDVMMVAMGESIKNSRILDRLSALLPHWPLPYVNKPNNIKKCARDTLYEILKNAPNTVIAKTQKKTNSNIKFEGTEFTLRPVDTHAGEGFVKVSSKCELISYLNNYQQDQIFYEAQFLNYASEDGFYRKYRIVLIEGFPYICHLAISDHWMVHYFPSGMELNEAKREEECLVMKHFDAQFAQKHKNAFEYISHALALDYVVLDCAQTREGALVVFEADTGAWVHATDPVSLFPYKPAVMQKVFDAFRQMLVNKMQNKLEPFA